MLDNVFVIEGDAKDWKESLRLTARELYRHGYVKDSFYDGCIEREKIFPTGLNSRIPVAIPHTDAVHVNKQAICVLKLKTPVAFYSMENGDETIKAEFVFNMALKKNEDQLILLKAVVDVVQDEQFLEKARALSAQALKALFYNKWMK